LSGLEVGALGLVTVRTTQKCWEIRYVRKVCVRHTYFFLKVLFSDYAKWVQLGKVKVYKHKKLHSSKDNSRLWGMNLITNFSTGIFSVPVQWQP